MKKVKERTNNNVQNGTKSKRIKVDLNRDVEEENNIRVLIIIVIVIVVLIGIVYAITEAVKKENLIQDEIKTGSINYDKTTVGTILNRPYDEYFVLLYDATDSNAVLYSTILTKYLQNTENKDFTKIYFCDLDNKLNEKYYNVNNDGKSNKKANKVEDFDFMDLTLLKIEKGKVIQYVEDLDEIKDILK